MPENNNIFYPSVKDLVSFDNLPASLSFVEEGLDTILEHIYFKDFVVHKTFYREFGEYRLTAIIFEDVGISFPGTDGLKLLLNPGNIEDSIEIPIVLNYYWTIIRYKNQFSFNSFDNAIKSIVEILFEVAGTTKEAFLLDAIETFIPEGGGIAEFVNQFNNEFTETLGLTDDQDLLVSTNEIMDFVGQNNYEIIDIVVTLFLNDAGFSFEELYNRVKALFDRYFGRLEKEDFYQILIPQFNFEITDIDLALQFPRKWLRPIYTGATDYPDVDPATIEIGEVLPEPYHSRLIYNVGRFKISSKKGFEFFDEDSFDFKRSEIGKTGLQVEFSNLKLDLRKDRNIPEASADGRSDDFRGVYAELAAVTLPKKWFNNVDNSTLRIAGYNMLIGTGGVSGTVAIETVNGTPNTNDDYMPVNIGNWELGFKNFDITFKQNAITESNIEGRLKIPKLKDGAGNDALIDIKGHLNEEGDFNLTASEAQGIPLSLFDFVTINFLTLELGREDEKFYVGTSCEVTFQNAIMQRVLGDQKIVLPKLRVYEDGSMEIVGGNAFIPTNISLNLGPIEIAVTGIHFGSHQQEKDGVMRKYNYWGFDGAISLDPLGIDARGEGIKYYYTTDNDEHGGDGDSFLRIQTIEVDLIIPGTANPDSALAIINGMLSIPEPGESPEYEGKIGLKLPKARISGAAQMRLQPKEPAFIIEAGIEMPTPIPLAATGLAFYGFGGLLGYKYVAEKEAIGLVSGENTWYEYYTYPKRGVNLDKFSGPPRTDQYNLPVAVGAGTVLGTMHDDGFLFSTRLMAILSLPSVFILDGRANVLGERLGILDDTEPPFFAGVAVGDNSFEFWFGADYQLPKSNGWIIDLYAEVQAGFFFNNPSAWYLNFGTKQSPITARVLTIITAQSYLMLSARGIEAGARVDLSLKKNFFGIKVEISAYVEVGGFISFERFQLGGYIAFGGTIAISVWKIVGFRVSLDAILSAEAAKPFLLYAEVRVRVCIRIIVKICKTFKVKLKWEKDNSVDRTPIPPLANGDNPNYPDRTEEAVQGVHMLTNETFALNYFPNQPMPSEIDKVIPLDTYIDFKAMKGLVPSAVSDKIGGHTGAAENFIDLIPPNKVVRGGKEVRQVKHKYSIENIGIYMADGSNWQPYHPFEAVVPVAERPNVNHLRIGYWQRNGEQYDSIRLLATNPFSYMEAGEPGWFIPEQYGITPSELYCVSKLETGDCSDMLEKPLGTKYYRPNGYIGHYIDGAYYSIEEGNGDLEQTIYVRTMQWTVPLVDPNNGEDITTVNFDRIRLRKDGTVTYPNIGVNADIYTLAGGVATNLIEISEQYLTGINTLLLNNGGKELNSLEILNVVETNGNLFVEVEVKSEYAYPNPDSDDMFFDNLFLRRLRQSGGASSQGSRSDSTETLITSSNEPTPVGCMEVTDVENNFNYAQSLQFSNADTLVIILPVATVNTDLKLTTYAEGVTIRYYKTLLSDTANTPQYQLVHEVYKTRAELSNVVSYTNENELITRITVTPKSANAHLIRAVREEIAELQEATYDSETGQIIPLTAAQQAQLAALQAELAQLEAQGCNQAQSELPLKTSSGSEKAKSASVPSTFFNSYSYTAPQVKGQLSNKYAKMKLIGGNYYAVGYPLFNVVSSSDTDGVLTKLDAAGNVMFSKVYFIDNQPVKFLDLHELSDGNILIIASLFGEKLFYIKVDTDGRIVWQRYFICEQGLDEHRVSVVKTRRQSFFISCLSTRLDHVYVFEINENGELINQTGLDGEGKYSYDIGASCLDPDDGLMVGVRRRDTEKPVIQSVILHFDSALQLKMKYLINSDSQVEITDMLMHEDRLYFILDDLVKSESTITYIWYYGKEFKELSSRALPAFRNWKLTGSDKPNTVIVAHNEAPVYRIGIQPDQSLAIDATFNFETPVPITGINDILYDGEQKKYTFITDTYLAVLQEDLASCVTIKDETIKGLPERAFTYTKIAALIKDFKQLSFVDGSIREAYQTLQLDEELCGGGGNGDCSKDEILCNFYETLQAALFGCINYKAKDPFNDNWNCFLDMIKSIEEFDGLYPQYGLMALLETDINTLLAYPEFARPPILEGAIGYANVILDKIYEIGKCDCTGEPEVPVVCNTSLQQVCWLSVEKFEYNQTIPGQAAIEQEQQDMEEAVQYTAQPIWRPNSTFYVHYQLKDEVDNGAGGDTFDYYYGFKTAGPIGHFHDADGVTYGNEYDENNNLINRVDTNGNPSATGKLTNPDKYPLTSLRQYIDYDKSYPNADGNLLQAKPVFYGQEQCRITLYFTKPLAYHMLRSWESYLGSPELTGAMHIAIKDPVSNVTIPYPLPIGYNEDSVPLPEGNGAGGVAWIDDNDPRIPLNIRLLNNFINYINENNDAIECTFTVGNAIQPQSYAYSVTLTNLKPQKLYTALIYNAFETESNDVVSSAQVHNYVFQTSRYQNFGAQVNSYLLVDEDDANNTRQAVFNVALPNLTTGDIDTAYNIVDGNPDANSDALETQYLDVFDRLLEGVLGMQPLDPAVNTEFNKILDGDGNIIAILIRNPEPFNIPKIPIAQINGTEEIFEAGATVGHRGAIRVFDKVTDVDDDAYKVLYSKDYSQAIIMHDSKQITADTLSFKFRYLIWDATTYVIDDTVRAEDIVLAQ
ncbi:hypothetical protein C8N46_10960 [Kordia periserrulae]|uniref:Uncharacterized protein n=1 Tax=Kordia periserrulae TaxID=701523 RepID=A0A2T6BTR8_9FLAO|nr:hypothetical protein [Kordia periserrulae]PTX59471.1 hypothetical protein C8N46_10960 [Kordia periserrulae]